MRRGGDTTMSGGEKEGSVGDDDVRRRLCGLHAEGPLASLAAVRSFAQLYDGLGSKPRLRARLLPRLAECGEAGTGCGSGCRPATITCTSHETKSST